MKETIISRVQVYGNVLFLFYYLILSGSRMNAQTRYWVGGTGSWTNTARWSTSSGGPGGAAVPLSTDDVIFDANSGSGTVTIPTGPTNVAQHVTFAAATSMSVVTGAGRLDLTGGLTLRPGMVTNAWTGVLYFYTPASVAPTRTITIANAVLRNSLIQFELPSSGTGGDVVVNGSFYQSTGSMVINLQNRTNSVTFAGVITPTISSLNVSRGTANMMTGFATTNTADITVAPVNGVFNSWGNGSCVDFFPSGAVNLNAGNTAAGNTYTFTTIRESNTVGVATSVLSIANCTVNVRSYWRYGYSVPAAGRSLVATNSLIRFFNTSTLFYPENFSFNDVKVDNDPANSDFSILFQPYYTTATAHTTQPNFNSVILDRNIVFSFDNQTPSSAACWPTFNTLLRFTPGHQYRYTSFQNEAIGGVFRLNIPNGSTLDMQGLCSAPIWLDKMPFEFGASSTILSDNIRLQGVGTHARNNSTPFAICNPLKPLGANSYTVNLGAANPGWSISTVPAHRNLVWVGPVPAITTGTNTSTWGNWYDPNNWIDVTANPTWASNPANAPGNPGIAPACPPTHRDSVIFPNNSYVNGDKLYQFCEGMNWQGAGRFYATSEKEMEVWGSLFLSPGMKNDFAGTYWFKSDRSYLCWITTNNQPFDGGLVFASNNGNGTWLLKDSLIARFPDPDCYTPYASLYLAGGHLHTGTATCTPGNGQTIEVHGMALIGGKISLYDSDVHVYGHASGNGQFNFRTTSKSLVTINAGTSHFIFMDKYNPGDGGSGSTSTGSQVSKAYFGEGHRLHEITVRRPATGSYIDFTNILYTANDTISRIVCEANTTPIIGTIYANSANFSNTHNGGLIRRLDLQSTLLTAFRGYGNSTTSLQGGVTNTYTVTIDSLTASGDINFGENVNIRSYLKFASGHSYVIGATVATPATDISINLMGASALSYNPFNCGVPYGASYTGATADISGNCVNLININNGRFIANTTASIQASYTNITDNSVQGPGAPFNYSNSNLTGTTTGWAGVASVARKLRWKNASAVASNVANWEDPNNWELVSGGTGTQTVMAPAPQCPPTRVDTAVFDNTSFSAAGQVVLINMPLTEVGSLYWQNIATGSNPTFSTTVNTNWLHIYASLAFHAAMQQNFSGPVLFRGDPGLGTTTFSVSTIRTGGKPFLNKIRFIGDADTKVWSLLDNLIAQNNLAVSGIAATTGEGTFNLIRGEFRTNGQTLTLGTFNSNSASSRKLDMTNSVINVTYGFLVTSANTGNSWVVCNVPSSFSLTSTGSTINFSNPLYQALIGGGKKYNNVNFINFSGSAGIYGGGASSAITTPNADRDTFNVVTFAGTGGLARIGLASSAPGTPYVSNNLQITKVISNRPLQIDAANNTFDTLIMNNTGVINSNNIYNKYVKFSPGYTYNMKSATVQWFKNLCQVDLFGSSGSNIQLYSTTTSQQAYFRKDSAFFCTDFINMRDIWAIGNGNNPAACNSYTNSGVNTNCLPGASFSTHAVSSCDTITDLASACGPWDAAGLARGRADFNAGVNADLQDNIFGWSKRGYPPNPVLNLASASYSICPGQPVILNMSGVANPPFTLFYIANGVTSTQAIMSSGDLLTYNPSTGAFTYTTAVTPTVNTIYRLGFLIIDRCFNPQSTTGTGTVNVTVRPVPAGLSLNFNPSALVCHGAQLTLTATATGASGYTMYPSPTGTTGAIPMTSYTAGAATNGSVTIPASGSYTAGSSPETYTLYASAQTPFGCPVPVRLPVTFTVNPIPAITNASAQALCSGNTVTITAVNSFTGNVVNNWTSPAVAGISGHSTGGAGAGITETLINTGANPLNVMYTYTPSAGGCTGQPQQFTVTVNPAPQMSSPTATTVCSNSALQINLTSNIPGTSYQWSATDNVNTSGESINTQTTPVLNDVITNTTAGLQQVVYQVLPTAAVSNCPGAAQSVTVDVNPAPQLSSASTATVCSGTPLNMALSANVASSYTWVATNNTNISGESVTGQVSPLINNTLAILTGTTSEAVIYTITPASTAGNCIGTAQQLTVTVNALPVVTAVPDNPAICSGYSTTLNAGGANTYTWTNGPASQSYTVSSAGNYTVTGTDANNCNNTQTVSLTVNPTPTVVISASSGTLCAGQTATLTAATANTYVWSTGSSSGSALVTPAASTVYTVTGTNTAGSCTATAQYTVIVNSLPTIAPSTVTQVSCFGLNNGSASFTNTSGTPGYTISGTGISGTTATGLSPNTYTYVVTDAAGCRNTTTLAITQPTAALSSLAAQTASNTSCTLPDGVATLTITGGTANYTVLSSSGTVSGNTISGLSTGPHSYTVTDANQCSMSNTMSVSGATGINSAITSQAAVLCFGNSTGSVSVTGSGEASGQYSYSLTPLTGGPVAGVVNTSGQYTGLTAGTYSVLVTGNPSNCISSQNINITQPAKAMSLTGITSPPVVCNGGTAQASATVSGGTAPYTYAWAVNSSTVSTATYTAGSYTVSIHDANGCALPVQGFTITQAPVLTIASVATTTTACGVAGGSATVTPNGGWNSAYSYTLSNGITTVYTNTATSLATGTYTAIVSDALGCSASSTFTISNPAAPTLSISANTATICQGQSLTLSPSGAVSYTLGTTVFTNSVAVAPGTTTVYQLTGADAANCVSAPLSLTVNVNTTPVISVAGTRTVVCAGSPVTLTASGATSYTWSTGTTGIATITVSPGSQTIYTVSGTDGTTGCQSRQAGSYTVAVDAIPLLAVSGQTNVSCFGNASGAVSFTSTAASPVYSPASTGLPAGTYTFTVNDQATGCNNTTTVTITGPASALSAAITGTAANSSCISPNGSYTVAATGGTPIYTYSSGNTSGIFTGQGTGAQTVTVSDANSCTYTLSVQIPGIPAPVITAFTQSNILCHQASTGTASITVSGGTPGYTYAWSNNAALNSQVQTHLPAGLYTVTATDAGSCTVSHVFVMTEPPPIQVISTGITAPCVGESNGSAGIEASGGTPAYTYTWTNHASTSNTITELREGQYVVTVTDANGCQYQYPVQVTAKGGMDCDMVIPEIFSPNGDGKNDTWEIKGLQAYPDNTVTIFNRWGDEVFRAAPYANDWSGSNTGDKSLMGKGDLPAGTYYFILDLANGDRPITGYVQLTR